MCGSYRIAFDGAGPRNFGNDVVRNVVIVLIIVHHLILTIARIIFSAIGRLDLQY